MNIVVLSRVKNCPSQIWCQYQHTWKRYWGRLPITSSRNQLHQEWKQDQSLLYLPSNWRCYSIKSIQWRFKWILCSLKVL